MSGKVSEQAYARITALAYLRSARHSLRLAHETLHAIDHPMARELSRALEDSFYAAQILQAGVEGDTE